MARLKALVTYTLCCASSLRSTCHNAIPPTLPSLLEACRGAGVCCVLQVPLVWTPLWDGTPSPAHGVPAAGDPLCTKQRSVHTLRVKQGCQRVLICLLDLWLVRFSLFTALEMKTIVCLLRVLVTWVIGEPQGVFLLNMWSNWYFKYLASMIMSRSLKNWVQLKNKWTFVFSVESDFSFSGHKTLFCACSCFSDLQSLKV